MNGRDFLAAARRLAAGPNEADWRSAASRAYYAAFHAARDLLASFRFRTPRADRAHNYLYVRLNNCGDPSLREAADPLHELRNLRNEADYDVRPLFPASAATTSITDADAILLAFDAIDPANRAQITGAIRAYEQTVGDVTWQP